MKRAELNLLIQCMYAVHNGCSRDATNAHGQLLDMCEPECPPLLVGSIVELSQPLTSLDPTFCVIPVGTRGKIIASGVRPIVHFTGIVGPRGAPPSFLKFIGYDTSAPTAPLNTPTTHIPNSQSFSDTEARVEYGKLLSYFNSSDGYTHYGKDGDEDGKTPAETAIRGMNRGELRRRSNLQQAERINAYEKILRGILDSVDVTLGVKLRPVGSPFSGLDYITLKVNIEKVLK